MTNRPEMTLKDILVVSMTVFLYISVGLLFTNGAFSFRVLSWPIECAIDLASAAVFLGAVSFAVLDSAIHGIHLPQHVFVWTHDIGKLADFWPVALFILAAEVYGLLLLTWFTGRFVWGLNHE